jgi:hypothetical protein
MSGLAIDLDAQLVSAEPYRQHAIRGGFKAAAAGSEACTAFRSAHARVGPTLRRSAVRHYRLLTALAVVNFLGLLLLAARPAPGAAQAAQPAPEVLRARLIELVDQQGQVRGQLKVEPDGEVVFRLRDARGNIRVKLGASETGSGLLLTDENSDPGVQILAGVSRLTHQRNNTVTLRDAAGGQRVLAATEQK